MADSAGGTGGRRPGPGRGKAPTEPSSPRRKRHWLRWTALGVTVLLLAAGGIGWALYSKLDRNIREDDTATSELERYERERPSNIAQDAENVLLIGSDTRAGDNGKYGRDGGTQRSDTTILLHVSAKRDRATAVSLPRDLMVDIPSCRRADGSRTEEQFAQFNWAFERGGTACTIRTVEKLTNVRVDHYIVVDFEGFKKMVDAVGGVDVCLARPIDDQDAHLKLPAGNQTLDGEQALGYVRVRKTLGNGSDTDRIDRQQRFLASLVSKMRSGGVLFNPTRLYPVLDAATSALTTDPGLASLRNLYDLVRGMRSIPSSQVRFMTVPRESYVNNPNRDQLVQPDAERLFEQLRKDSPVRVVPDPSASSSPDSSAAAPADPSSVRGPGGAAVRGVAPAEGSGAGPAYRGTSAADTDCPAPQVKE